MKKLYRFYWDCGRNGEIEGVFVSDSAIMEGAIGKNADLGESLGKHSHVHGVIGKEDITVLTDDASFIERFEQFLPRGAGYNPLNYLSEEEGET